MTDWKIVLEPKADLDWPGGSGCLEVLDTDEDGAVEALEGWAETIERHGYVPEGLDWRNLAGCAVVRRVGRLRFAVRCDTFERETDSGTSTGAGWLRASEC